jgi:hypothetical protein
MEYKLLESSSFKEALGINTPGYDPSNISFFTTTSFIYTLLFSAIVAAAFYEYILVGIYRMEASESGIRKSNETFKRTTLGLLGVFSLFLIIFTLNKSLLTGNVDLTEFKAGAVAGGGSGLSVTTGSTAGTGSGGSGGSSRSCGSTEATISKLQSSGGICGDAACTALSGCNYQQYMSIIDQAVGNDAQLKKMIIVTMCKESHGDPRASHLNSSNGTYDCGLMQINQSGPCNSAILIEPSNISANIQAGVTKMKEKIRNTTQVYSNIPAETGPFSSYNCCANGTVPNSPSADCTSSSGFPFSIPKWACPINPGDGDFNMCSVKSYVCELSACMKQL